jgi:hypothetical protein
MFVRVGLNPAKRFTKRFKKKVHKITPPPYYQVEIEVYYCDGTVR